MIIYYQKSTNKILSVVGSGSKKKITDDELENELNSMFPTMIDDVGVNRFEDEEKKIVSCGGIWDNEKKEMTKEPEPEPVPEKTTEQKRADELLVKFEDQSATQKEIQEFLFLKFS